jgi:RNA polymerase sigma-70 factor (ECF subfamily)
VPGKPWGTEEKLLARLRAGDEAAFAQLVDDLHARLVAMAATFTTSPALAEDIAQETWLAVIRGVRRFEGRSSLRTWIFSILIRRARTMAAKEAKRAVPPQEVAEVEWEPGRGRAGLWTERPRPWGLEDPAAVFQTKEALEVVRKAIEQLPPVQRQVVLLRDVEDVSALDVCNILQISETNQRVLLHRGRARIRRALDCYVRGQESLRRARGASEAPGARPAADTPVPIRGPVQADEEEHGMS